MKYEERPRPSFTNENTIIRINRIGICGTDFHAFEGTQPFFQYPRVLGHELAAHVVEVGLVKGFKSGERVTIIPLCSFVVHALPVEGEKRIAVLQSVFAGAQPMEFFHTKNGTPGVAYFFIPSSFISTPIPGLSNSLMKLFSTIGPSNVTISLNIGSV